MVVLVIHAQWELFRTDALSPGYNSVEPMSRADAEKQKREARHRRQRPWSLCKK